MLDDELFESWLEHANETTLINALKDYRKIVIDLKNKLTEIELNNIDNRIMNKSAVDWVFRHSEIPQEEEEEEEVEITTEQELNIEQIENILGEV